MYTLGYIGTANLTRFSEGATYVAVVYVSHSSQLLMYFQEFHIFAVFVERME
jgi:hypothetical protein